MTLGRYHLMKGSGIDYSLICTSVRPPESRSCFPVEESSERPGYPHAAFGIG